MIAIKTIKPSGEERTVVLCKHKQTGGYSFVNLTTGNITPCIFNTEEDAIRDLNNYVHSGKLKGYHIIPEQEVLGLF